MSTKDVWDPKVNDGATRGGLSVTIVGDDGVRYYGSHLSAIDPALVVGGHVDVGQPLGKVGNTGDARGHRSATSTSASQRRVVSATGRCAAAPFSPRRSSTRGARATRARRLTHRRARRRDRAYFVPTMTRAVPGILTLPSSD